MTNSNSSIGLHNGDEHMLWRIENDYPCSLNVKKTAAAGRVNILAGVNGYPLTWGNIAQSNLPGMSIWDFYFADETFFLERSRNDLIFVQTLVFDALELSLDCVSRAYIATYDALEEYPWKIIPGGLNTGCMFTVVCRYEHDKRCRAWMVTELIPDIIPAVVESVQIQRQAHDI
jgi:hypothetical protein